MKDLAEIEEGISDTGRAKAERIRGAIANIVYIRSFMENARKFVPPVKQDGQIATKDLAPNQDD